MGDIQKTINHVEANLYIMRVRKHKQKTELLIHKPQKGGKHITSRLFPLQNNDSYISSLFCQYCFVSKEPSSFLLYNLKEIGKCNEITTFYCCFVIKILLAQKSCCTRPAKCDFPTCTKLLLALLAFQQQGEFLQSEGGFRPVEK